MYLVEHSHLLHRGGGGLGHAGAAMGLPTVLHPDPHVSTVKSSPIATGGNIVAACRKKEKGRGIEREYGGRAVRYM